MGQRGPEFSRDCSDSGRCLDIPEDGASGLGMELMTYKRIEVLLIGTKK